MWLVQGLDDGRFALITKTHHALVDGISGVDLATVLFDLGPVPVRVEHPPAAWTPQPSPSGIELVARGVRGVLSVPFEAAGRVLDAATHPGESLQDTREALEGLGEVVWAALNPAPATPLNVAIGPHRRLVWVRQDLRDFKRVKDALGGTVNDVVLATVAARCRRGCARAASAPRGSSCGRSSLSRSAGATSSTSSATGSRRCARRCRSTSRIRSRGCTSCATRWTG